VGTWHQQPRKKASKPDLRLHPFSFPLKPFWAVHWKLDLTTRLSRPPDLRPTAPAFHSFIGQKPRNLSSEAPSYSSRNEDTEGRPSKVSLSLFLPGMM
jgi:hypothetical protein